MTVFLHRWHVLPHVWPVQPHVWLLLPHVWLLLPHVWLLLLNVWLLLLNVWLIFPLYDLFLLMYDLFFLMYAIFRERQIFDNIGNIIFPPNLNQRTSSMFSPFSCVCQTDTFSLLTEKSNILQLHLLHFFKFVLMIVLLYAKICFYLWCKIDVTNS